MGRHAAFILVLAGVLATARPAGSGPRKDAGQDQAARTAIVALLKAQQDDWNRGDIKAFMAGYWNSPELTFAGSKGFTRGWQPVLERYEKTYADRAAMGKLDFSELEVRPLGPDAALVLGHWHLQRQIGDVGGIFTLVLQKFPEGWRIIHDHTTQSPSDPQPAK
jgi:ketosteroid isomerase-like protein